MAYSSGIKHFMREASSWVAVAALGFAGVYYFDDLRGFAAQTITSAVSKIDTEVNDPVQKQRQFTSGFERSVTLTASRNGHFIRPNFIHGLFPHAHNGPHDKGQDRNH